MTKKMTKTKTKIKPKLKGTKEFKTKTKNQTGNQTTYNMKTMRRKKSQTMAKDTKLEDKAKGSIEGGGKKLLRSPHLIHLYLIGIL